MTIKNILITLISSIFLFSCAGKGADIATQYSADSGELDLREYLSGNLEGVGIVQNKDGIVTKKFIVKVTGDWEGDKGVVKRQFLFSNDEKDSRTWLITMDKNNFLGVGHDIIGNAIGKQHAGVAQVRYKLSMKIDGVKETVDVEELTHKINGNSSISILSLRKGFSNKGRIIISLTKASKVEKVAKSPTPSPEIIEEKKEEVEEKDAKNKVFTIKTKKKIADNPR